MSEYNVVPSDITVQQNGGTTSVNRLLTNQRFEMLLGSFSVNVASEIRDLILNGGTITGD